MKKITFLMAAIALSFSAMAVGLSGTYKVGTTEVAPNYTSLSAAVTDLNTLGVAGNVVLEITSDLSEAGGVKLLVASMGSNTITIKPAAAVSPTITFSACVATAGATQYSGFAADNTSNLIIDGSNSGGITKDMTFKMNDATNGRNIIQLFGNCDNDTVKNLNIIYQAPMSTANTTRGIYLNGQSTGACDNFTVQNCTIGDATLTPYYGVGATGSSSSLIYCTNLGIKDNIIFGRIRPVYMFYVGTAGTTNEVTGNTISTIGGVNGTTTYTIMYNTWAGTLNIKNNKIPVLTVANTSGTSGVYGISGLTATVGSVVNMSNNFIGGTNSSTGVAVPGVFSLMYIQDNATYNIYNNTFLYQSMTNATEKSNIHISGASCVVNMKNNIIINNTDVATAYCIWKSNGTLNSDYNDLYVSGALANIGFLSSARKTLTDWQGAFTPNNDVNSKSGNANFVDAAAGDLRISTASYNDENLQAPRLPDVLTDMFGSLRLRRPTTYKGAHAAEIEIISNVSTPTLSYQIMRTATGVQVNLDNESTVELFSINGTLIEKTKTNGMYSRDLNNGVYIIRINGKATKFIR